MHILIEQNILQNAISSSNRMFLIKNVVESLNGILLECGEKIKMTTSDGVHIIEVEIKGEILEKGVVLIPAKIFSDTIRRLNSGKIDISKKDNQILIKAKSAKMQIACMDENEYPKVKIENIPDKLEIDFPLFKEMVRQTIFAVSKDEKRQILQGVKFELTENSFTMVALDLFRIAVVTKPITFSTNIEVVVPSMILYEMVRQGSQGKITLSFDQKVMIFKYKSVTIIARLVYGEYVDYRKAIPKEFKTTMEISTEKLRQGVDRISVFSRNTDNLHVMFKIRKDNLSIYASTALGEGSEEIDVITSGEDIDISLNPQFLLEGLKEFNTDTVVMSFVDSINPCMISTKEKNGYFYMIVPMRNPY